MKTDIYIAKTDKLKNQELFMYLYEHMDKNRRQKIDRIRSFNGKCLSLGAGAVLKKALSDVGMNADSAEVVYDTNGKPYIKNSSVFFNLSHSADRVACAISDADVGCDVERIRDVNINIAKRFFSQNEYDLILKQTDINKRYDMFFRLWTLKESLVKAAGKGLTFPLPEFLVDKDADNISISASFEGKKYYFKEYNLYDGYRYACCCRKNNFANIILTELDQIVF